MPPHLSLLIGGPNSVGARVLGDDTANAERDEAKIILGVYARAKVKRLLVEEPLHLHCWVIDGNKFDFKAKIISFGQLHILQIAEKFWRIVALAVWHFLETVVPRLFQFWNSLKAFGMKRVLEQGLLCVHHQFH